MQSGQEQRTHDKTRAARATSSGGGNENDDRNERQGANQMWTSTISSQPYSLASFILNKNTKNKSLLQRSLWRSVSFSIPDTKWYRKPHLIPARALAQSTQNPFPAWARWSNTKTLRSVHTGHSAPQAH